MGNQKGSGAAPNQAMGPGLSSPGNIAMRFGRGVSATPAQQQVSSFAPQGQGGNFQQAQASGPNASAYAYSNSNGQGQSATADGMPAGSSDVPLPPTGQTLPGGLSMLPGGGVSFANGDFMNPNGFQLGGMTWNGQQFQMPGLSVSNGMNGQAPSVSMNGQPMMPNVGGLLGMFNRGNS